MKLFDSHAHLASLDGDIVPILERAKEAGVTAIMNIATTPVELEFGLGLGSSTPRIFHAAATTPHDVEKKGEADFALFEQQVIKLTAIGETGLDYHYTHSPKETQQHFLRRYLGLAKAAGLPVIFHCREAFSDLFRIVKEENFEGPCLLHCFTGTFEEANEVVARGWALSLSGIVTFKKSEELRQVAKTIPLSHLLIETDAPYLAPQLYRGTPNEPAFLLETAKCIANVRQMDVEEFTEATVNNTLRFFRIKI